MIKIAFIIDTIETDAAGTEKQLLMLLNSLDNTKFRPYLICLRDSTWLKGQRFSFEVITYDLSKLLSLRFIKYALQFIRFHKREKFDVVQTFFVDANIFGTVAARFAGCRTIISSRRDLGYWYNKTNLFILRFLRRWTTHYLVNSQAVADKVSELEGIYPERIKVIRNGLDLEKFKSVDAKLRVRQRSEWGIDDHETLVGAVANLRDVKNIGSLVQAAAEICQSMDRVKFIVVGEGPERRSLQALINRLGITNKFRLAGRYADILPCLAAFDMAVLCSRFEGFSNSLIEYMAAALPIVASDAGGNSEAITHNQTGLLYSVDDDNGLVRSISELLNDRHKATRLGENAKLKATLNYSIQAAIRNQEDFYTGILKGGDHRSEEY